MLAKVVDGVEECRAAAATADEGDPDALRALSTEVDLLAERVAQLKALVSTPAL